jgi:hypothetical protein
MTRPARASRLARAPSPSENPLRTPFRPTTAPRERGTIVSVDAARHTYHVATNSGRNFYGIARLRSSPTDLTLLPPGTPVMVDPALGEPYILGVLPYQCAAVAGEDPDSVTGTTGHGGEDPALNRNFGATARAPGEPRDLMPGDSAMRSPDGASVAALQGKVAQLRGSPLAQITAHGLTNQVDVIAGLLRVITWMGESRVVNEDGKTSFVWRGGADQLTQSGADEERYTVRLDVGHTGDLVNFEVTTPAGQSLFRFHVSPEGRVSVVSRGGWEVTSGADRAMEHPQRIHGAHAVEVEGAQTVRVAADTAHAYEANRKTAVTSNDTRVVGGNDVHRVNGDHDANVGGVHNTAVTGNVTRVSSQGDMKDSVTQGNYDAHVQTGHWKALLDSGDFIAELSSGTFKVKGQTLELGGDSPTNHVMVFEEFRTLWNQFIQHYNQFVQLVATHFHPASSGTTTPSSTLTSSQPFSGDISNIQSQYVKTP